MNQLKLLTGYAALGIDFIDVKLKGLKLGIAQKGSGTCYGEKRANLNGIRGNRRGLTEQTK